MGKRKSLFEAAGLVDKSKTPIFQKGGKIIPSQIDKEIARVEGTSLKPVKKEKEEDKYKEEMMVKGAAFIGKMFRLRDTTHLLHLKTKSYAEHIALNDFYDELLDLTDGLAEAMQCCGLLDIRIPASVIDHTALDYITTFKEDVKAFRKECMRDDIINLLDDVATLCSTTVYKLKFLK